MICYPHDSIAVGRSHEPAGPLPGRAAPRDAALRLPLRRRGVPQGQPHMNPFPKAMKTTEF